MDQSRKLERDSPNKNIIFTESLFRSLHLEPPLSVSVKGKPDMQISRWRLARGDCLCPPHPHACKDSSWVGLVN